MKKDTRSVLWPLLPAAVRCDVALHQAERETCKKASSAVRCDMVLHRVFRARHLKHQM